MPLLPGSRVGAFEILARIGAGGMGEVYRARDTRLDRTVAVKILVSSEFERHDRLERLKREARAISRLNHPHICSLYDIAEHEGETFLVMEYVQGQTLAERLSRGPLRLDDVLRYGAQMADALDAAHRQGVVHRDLKPSNIMLAHDGVKLLDFGLAKLRHEESSNASGTITTLSLPLSQDGLIVGTLPYMAPEQVEGKEVDARTDIFALGAVLYEMASGEAPFRGASKASLIAAILGHDPPPLTSRQPVMPPLLDRAIHRCLAKDPDDRWQTARDLAAELKYVLDTLHQGHPRTEAPHRASRRLATASISIAAVAAVLLAAIPLSREAERPPPSFRQLTFRRGMISSARFAPDEQTVVYSASWEGKPYDLYLTRLGSHESRALGLPNARLFAISSSGALAFVRGPQSVYRASGTLAQVPLAGGAPRELLENVSFADWTPGGSQLAIVRRVADSPGKALIEFPIGTTRYESRAAVREIRVSRSGDRIAFTEGGTINILDQSGAKKPISTGWTVTFGIAWSTDESEIWLAGSKGDGAPALHAVSLAGKERLLAAAAGDLRLQDVSPNGRILAIRDHGRDGVACRAPDAAIDRDLSWFDGSSLEALSPDGGTIVFGEIRAGGGPAKGIYLRKTDGSAAVRLGDGYPEDLSPDGRWVLARPNPSLSNTGQLGWVLLPVGAGSPRSLPLGSVAGLNEANFLPDGQRIAFGGGEQGRGFRIWIQDLKGGIPRAISPEGVRTAARVTPDGRFVEGSSAGRHVLYPVDGGEPHVLSFLSAEDSVLQWTPDGRFLYVLRGSPWSETPAEVFHTTEAVVEKVDATTGVRHPWKTVKSADPVGFDGISTLYITPDGNSYCYGYLRTLSDLFLIEDVK